MVTGPLHTAFALGGENMCLRRMCAIRRRPEESYHQHITQATRTARTWFHQRGYKSTATLLLERQHRIVGSSFQRLALDLEKRLSSPSTMNLDASVLVEHPLTVSAHCRKPSLSIVALTLLWRSHSWWVWQQALMTCVDSANTTSWKHSRSGPQRTWDWSFVSVFGEHWMKQAIQQNWKDFRGKYVDGAYAMIGIKSLEQRYAPRKSSPACDGAASWSSKQPRDVQWEPQEWSSDASMRLEVCGDSPVVIQWLNGRKGLNQQSFDP